MKATALWTLLTGETVFDLVAKPARHPQHARDSRDEASSDDEEHLVATDSQGKSLLSRTAEEHR